MDRRLNDPIVRAARSIESVEPDIPRGEELTKLREIIGSGVQRGHFTPEEDVRIQDGFRRYLRSRAVLRQTIQELRPLAIDPHPDSREQLRAFTVAYCAACLLVRAGRAMVGELAHESVIRRKLNEPDPVHGIPQKQFTTIYRSLTSPRNAWRLQRAREFAQENRPAIQELSQDKPLAGVVELLGDCECALDVTVSRYLRGRLRFLWHSLRRRNWSTYQHTMFALFEGSGRVISEMRLGFRKRVNKTVLAKLEEFLQPGDVIVTRHHDAMSNLFLPGYWPHSAFHIGTDREREQLGVKVNRGQAMRWSGDVRVLEAKKDGVLLRPLRETLAVDAVAVIRPQLPRGELAQAIGRALQHEGKLYDFAFDFFRADRLVCTEVAYRALDGLGPIRFEPKTRAGRPTISAEDLLDMALDDRGFEPVALFGTPQTRRRLVTGAEVAPLLAKSYRSSENSGAPQRD